MRPHTFVPSGIQGDPSCATCALPRANARHGVVDPERVEQVVVVRVRTRNDSSLPAEWDWTTLLDDEAEVIAAGPATPVVEETPPVRNVDRYLVNDKINDIAGYLGVTLTDEVLNELTHTVADALDRSPNTML